MLYLVRKKGESVIINGNIEVKVIEVKGSSTKLGFDFPTTATVLRKEIHDRIVAENLAAASSADVGNELQQIDFSIGNKANTDKPKLKINKHKPDPGNEA